MFNAKFMTQSGRIAQLCLFLQIFLFQSSHHPLRGRCPAPLNLKSRTTQAGHGYRWPLTAFGLLFSFVTDWLSFGLGGRGLNPRGNQWMDRRTDGEWGGQISPLRVSAQKVSIHACEACWDAVRFELWQKSLEITFTGDLVVKFSQLCWLNDKNVF